MMASFESVVILGRFSLGWRGGAPTIYGRTPSPVASRDPVEVESVRGRTVDVGGFKEVGGQLVAEGGRAVRVYCAQGAEIGMMVEVVVVGVVDRVPGEDDGGILASVGEVGRGEGCVLDRSGRALTLKR